MSGANVPGARALDRQAEQASHREVRVLDIALATFIVIVMAIGFRRPFVWVLAYLYVDILTPGKMGWTLMPMLKVSLVTFIAAFGGWLLADPKRGAKFTFRQGLMVLFLLYCGWTTLNADFPQFALDKWSWVWKGLVFAIFVPLALTTRLRIESALLVMLLSLASILIGAGIKVVLGGGGYENRLFIVNDNSGLYESSTLATVAICSIPLIVWMVQHGTIFPKDWRVKLFAAGVVFACLLMPIGTEARTGLLCVAMLLLLSLRDVKRRLTFLVAGATLVFVALPFIPQSYYDRMATLGAPEGDQSASTRLAVWQWTIDYSKRNPMGGGFDSFRSNKFSYRMPVVEGEGNTKAVEIREVTDSSRAFHSAIFELLGEQGYFGLGLWLWIHAIGLWQMERIRRQWRKKERNGTLPDDQQWVRPLATALQYAQIIYLVGSLFQGLAYQPFVWILVGVQIAVWTYTRRLDKASEWIAARRAPETTADAPRHAVAAPKAALRRARS